MPLGARVRVRGEILQDKKHGEQLKVQSLIELVPDTLTGLEKYLASGLIKGVGPKLAQRIVTTFGLDALRVLDEQPERLNEVEGLGEKRRTALAKAWREQRALRDVMVFLQAHGASPALAARIVRRYGASAMTIVSRDPYRLALDVRGVGFKTADRIAATLGVAPDSPERMQAAMLQVVHDVTEDGHVWTDDGDVAGRAALMLGLPADDDELSAPVWGGQPRPSCSPGASSSRASTESEPSTRPKCMRPRCASQRGSARSRELRREPFKACPRRLPRSNRGRVSSSRPNSVAPSRRRPRARCWS